MLIKREILDGIRRGDITLQFRRWKRRTIKPGGTLKTKVGVLRIGAITPIEAEAVTDDDARAAGFADASDFRAWLDTMKPGELDRIEVSYLGEDPRAALRRDADLSHAELSEISAALDDMDRRAEIGAWTSRAMELIANHPGRLAEQLADEMGLQKHPFKSRVRKLKAMGLTESLKVGYRLSPRGEKVHAFRNARQAAR